MYFSKWVLLPIVVVFFILGLFFSQRILFVKVINQSQNYKASISTINGFKLGRFIKNNGLIKNKITKLLDGNGVARKKISPTQVNGIEVILVDDDQKNNGYMKEIDGQLIPMVNSSSDIINGKLVIKLFLNPALVAGYEDRVISRIALTQIISELGVSTGNKPSIKTALNGLKNDINTFVDIRKK